MLKPAVVVPAFNRAGSLRRLLLSISDALVSVQPNVIISLEGGTTDAVANEAEQFAATYPNCTIIRRTERLGLRRHILACGDLSQDFGPIILLEDDLMVDPQFYSYASAVIKFYADAPNIAGFALYSPELNEFAGLPFKPMDNGFDTYFMRTPCSWGQVWTAAQWARFRTWYEKADAASVSSVQSLPSCVKLWPETSWKKYFAAYMSLNCLDFVYPFKSLTTNCADDGRTHMTRGTSLYQVALGDPLRPMRSLCFAPPKPDPRVAYDEHMEACGSLVHEWLGLSPTEVAVDLYGIKPVESYKHMPFVITSRPVRKNLGRVALKFRPIDGNLRFFGREDNKDISGVCLALANPEDVIEGRPRDVVGLLSYFSGINLGSIRYGVALGRNILIKLAVLQAKRAMQGIGLSCGYFKN